MNKKLLVSFFLLLPAFGLVLYGQTATIPEWHELKIPAREYHDTAYSVRKSEKVVFVQKGSTLLRYDWISGEELPSIRLRLVPDWIQVQDDILIVCSELKDTNTLLFQSEWEIIAYEAETMKLIWEKKFDETVEFAGFMDSTLLLSGYGHSPEDWSPGGIGGYLRSRTGLEIHTGTIVFRHLNNGIDYAEENWSEYWLFDADNMFQLFFTSRGRWINTFPDRPNPRFPPDTNLISTSEFYLDHSVGNSQIPGHILDSSIVSCFDIDNDTVVWQQESGAGYLQAFGNYKQDIVCWYFDFLKNEIWFLDRETGRIRKKIPSPQLNSINKNFGTFAGKYFWYFYIMPEDPEGFSLRGRRINLETGENIRLTGETGDLYEIEIVGADENCLTLLALERVGDNTLMYPNHFRLLYFCLK